VTSGHKFSEKVKALLVANLAKWPVSFSTQESIVRTLEYNDMGPNGFEPNESKALLLAIELEKLGLSELASTIALSAHGAIDKLREQMNEEQKVYLELVSPNGNKSVLNMIAGNKEFREIVLAKARRNEAGVAEHIAKQKVSQLPKPESAFGILYTD
jgi:hypothetical protein